ncbi:MAG: prolipoprotein diacylglyceryl transferase [Marinoscillum sp.]
MSWIDKLQERWNLKNGLQVMLVLVVFACTGFTVMFLKKPVQDFFLDDGERTLWFSIGYWILIFPVYNVILLCYGLVFGQFQFFWQFEKRMISRMTGKKKDA